MTAVLESSSGTIHPLALDRWCADASDTDRALTAGLHEPTLDVGCGPGRLVRLLAEQGTAVLGVDVSPAALSRARARGATVLQRSVWSPLPGEGRWMNVLLIDGNIGIGGDPLRLLLRISQLLAPTGSAIIEVDPPGTGLRREAVRLDHHGQFSEWFPWAWVGADAVTELAHATGLTFKDRVHLDDRWFVHLKPTAEPGPDLARDLNETVSS